MREIRPGARIKSGFWPEPVRVIFAEEKEGLWRVEAVGECTGRYYGERWLSSEDLGVVEILPQKGPNFLGQAEAVFLGLEAQRIRLAHAALPAEKKTVVQYELDWRKWAKPAVSA